MIPASGSTPALALQCRNAMVEGPELIAMQIELWATDQSL
jgi:hypothetical protein